MFMHGHLAQDTQVMRGRSVTQGAPRRSMADSSAAGRYQKVWGFAEWLVVWSIWQSLAE